MLNRNNERELAYVVVIDDVTPINGYDRVELAHVGGWTVVVGKGEFKAGDPAIYFEIDSQLPEVKPFIDMEFLAKKHYKIKTQKMCKSISQGLLMSAQNFGWDIGCDWNNTRPFILDDSDNRHYSDDESRFLTKQLGITYAVPEDNSRKSNKPVNKYDKMAKRHGKLFSKMPFRWLMRREWGRKLLFMFFGRKMDSRGFPSWVVKTDEERCQNMPWIVNDKQPFVATEKIDGTSTTFTLKRGKGLFGKDEFYVCSRNVCFDKAGAKCFYDKNVYTEMAEKYDIENKMKMLLNEVFTDCDWITIQGETYGSGIQKRDYSIPTHRFMAFNFVTSNDGRWSTHSMKNLLEANDIPCVPIVDDKYTLPDTIEELLKYADGKSVVDGGMREGIVFRSLDGKKSFKAVSNDYLLKFHQ